jgi:hypothetical protein
MRITLEVNGHELPGAEMSAEELVDILISRSSAIVVPPIQVTLKVKSANVGGMEVVQRVALL